MGASYWARWACDGEISNLPNLLLPCVLAEGYDLLACDADRQVYDRGGVMKKIAWSLNGGRWSEAPVDLTITYTFSPTRTVANFYWKLAVRPFPVTQKEQASFEAWIRSQMSRILAGLTEQEWADTVTDEPLAIRTTSNDGDGPMFPGDQLIGADTAVRSTRARRTVQCASMCVEEPPHCDRCWKPAVAIPGTTGRYYCLTCRRHLPRRAALKTS